MFVPIGTVSHHFLCLRDSYVLYHRGSKTESYVYRSLKFQVNYEVALVVRPTLSVDMLTRKGVLVVFGNVIWLRRLFRLQFQCQVKRVMRKFESQETCQSVKQCWKEHVK